MTNKTEHPATLEDYFSTLQTQVIKLGDDVLSFSKNLVDLQEHVLRQDKRIPLYCGHCQNWKLPEFMETETQCYSCAQFQADLSGEGTSLVTKEETEVEVEK